MSDHPPIEALDRTISEAETTAVAPASGDVERVAKAICAARGHNPEMLFQHREGADYPTDSTVEYKLPWESEKRVQLMHYAWRGFTKEAEAAIAALTPPATVPPRGCQCDCHKTRAVCENECCQPLGATVPLQLLDEVEAAYKEGWINGNSSDSDADEDWQRSNTRIISLIAADAGNTTVPPQQGDVPKPVSVDLSLAAARLNKYVAENLFNNANAVFTETHIQGMAKAVMGENGVNGSLPMEGSNPSLPHTIQPDDCFEKWAENKPWFNPTRTSGIHHYYDDATQAAYEAWTEITPKREISKRDMHKMQVEIADKIFADCVAPSPEYAGRQAAIAVAVLKKYFPEITAIEIQGG